jgi:GDP-L-fucose synthase
MVSGSAIPVNEADRIYVAVHSGLVGSAICRRLAVGGYRNVITRTHSQLDLTSQAAVERFFREECPHIVFLAGPQPRYRT